MAAFPDRATDQSRSDELHRLRAEAERALERWRAVERGVRAIAGALDAGEVLTQLRLAVLPELADVCIVHRLTPSGLERALVEAADPSIAEEVKRLVRASPPPVAGHPIALALQTGRSELIDDGAESRLLLRRIGGRTALVLPLIARGRPLGTLSLVHVGTRSHGREDLALAESLAQAAAIALDNARLFTEACERVRERDDHLTMVAHDLKNPLLAVRMEADRLLRDGDHVPEAAARIGRQVQAMSQMAGELLDFAGFEQGRARLTLEPVDPSALVSEALDTFAPIAAAEGVALEQRLADPRLPRVSCDRARIWQVFSNLLANAIRHGQAGRVTVSAAVHTGEVRFSVDDAGRAIEAAELARLFEAGHSTGGSTGLGLAICRRIVEAHGGWIWAESAAGQGATFHFTLPVAPID